MNMYVITTCNKEQLVRTGMRNENTVLLV